MFTNRIYAIHRALPNRVSFDVTRLIAGYEVEYKEETLLPSAEYQKKMMEVHLQISEMVDPWEPTFPSYYEQKDHVDSKDAYLGKFRPGGKWMWLEKENRNLHYRVSRVETGNIYKHTENPGGDWHKFFGMPRFFHAPGNWETRLEIEKLGRIFKLERCLGRSFRKYLMMVDAKAPVSRLPPLPMPPEPLWRIRLDCIHVCLPSTLPFDISKLVAQYDLDIGDFPDVEFDSTQLAMRCQFSVDVKISWCEPPRGEYYIGRFVHPIIGCQMWAILNTSFREPNREELKGKKFDGCWHPSDAYGWARILGVDYMRNQVGVVRALNETAKCLTRQKRLIKLARSISTKCSSDLMCIERAQWYPGFGEERKQVVQGCGTKRKSDSIESDAKRPKKTTAMDFTEDDEFTMQGLVWFP